MQGRQPATAEHFNIGDSDLDEGGADAAAGSAPQALPKDVSGSGEHVSARYALFRYFLVKHSWRIKGLSLEVAEYRA